MRKLLLAWLIVMVTASASAADRSLIEGIVIRVNDRIVTIADMRQRIAERAAEGSQPITASQVAPFVREITDELCMLERAAELKLEVSAEELEGTMKQLREQNRAQDDATFEAQLRTMGLTIEQVRNRMRDTLLINRLLSREVGNLPVTDAELRQRYERDKEQYRLPERVHLEHIVIPVTKEPADLERKMSLAKRLVAGVRAGESFKTLVEHEVAAGVGNGGDLGEVALPDLRAEVRNAVASLKDGEVSEPFTSSAGVHVVRLINRIPPGHKPFEQVAQELRERELAERYRTHLGSVVAELKKRFVVESHPELVTGLK